MKLSGCNRKVQLVSGATFGLLLGLFACPSNARAGCGDYVHLGQKSAGQAMTMPEKHHPHPSRSDHKFPCSGPNCSRGSQLPLQPATTISSTSEHWALAQFSLILKDLDPVQPAPSLNLGQYLRNEFSVFHPPRASLS
ncbi:MAG TPA: hypothetical protein VGX70_08225 [Gemmataceae bacterium]|jgi:hypothetical protein|nr:hypothetical protein [Gemmataceae bacterium]